MKKHYELRKAICEWNVFQFVVCILFFASLLAPGTLIAQSIHIATLRPDEAAAGMNVVLELLSVNETQSLLARPFGTDGLDSRSQIILVHPQDTNRIVFGPVEASWDGRVLQVPVFISPKAAAGQIPFFIYSAITGRFSDTVALQIVTPQHLGMLNGDITLGDGIGILSPGNALVVDSFLATNATIHFSTAKTDTSAGNPRFLPVVILSNGPVRLANTTISVDADSLNGGPGGGGGGHGFPGAGGTGFTGGGSCYIDSLPNNGSDSTATPLAGGKSATGTSGGGSVTDDQGGGGGTGAPYGVSGSAGAANTGSPRGEFGGGSGGGEASPTLVEYGGGGGGFGTNGFGGGQPGLAGPNGGIANGGRFLVPLSGGSGGGSGNSVDNGGGTQGGSGGGGGGALEIEAFDSIYLNSSTLSADGDSGTSGFRIAAGGGGGSGGGIYLASPRGIRANSAHIRVAGGEGGQAGEQGYPGGSGGLGRVRIDAGNNLAPGPDSSVWVNGIAFTPSKQVMVHDSIHLTGVARDTINSLDTIRIFYRSQNTNWQFIDTVRAPDGSWSKWIPTHHDSVVYAVAMVDVNGPSTQESNYEPPWLMSPASLTVVHAQASPYLVSVDSLNFDSVRIGGCKSLRLRIANDGEAPLLLHSGVFSGSNAFSISPDTDLTIFPFSADTLTITFCPDSAGEAVGSLSFRSNDSEDSAKQVALFGFGMALHDSLIVTPDSLRFDRVLLGECATDTVLLKSVGHDPIRLDSSHWNDSPFALRLIPPDTVLDSGVIRELLVTFCPSDTGILRFAPLLDARGDSLPITGRGVLRLVSSTPHIDAGTLCFGTPDTVQEVISNLGNDTISIFSLHGTTIAFDSIAVLLEPRSSDTIPILIPTIRLGSFIDTLAILLAGDTLYTVIDYRIAGPSLSIASDLSFHFVCMGECLDSAVGIFNSGSDTISISYDSLRAGGPFTLLPSATLLPPGGLDSMRLEFCPTLLDSGEQNDTVRFDARVNGCDSLFVLALNGTGYDSIAAEPLSFDSVPLGSCHDSSLFIGNPCGPAEIVDTVAFSNPDFHLISSLPDTVPSDGNAQLRVRFCPSTVDTERGQVTLRLANGKLITALLSGIGFKKAVPSAYFAISSATVTMGDTAVTSINFDSSSLTGKHRVSFLLTFDPTVVAPIDRFPLLDTLHGLDTLTFSEVLNFDTTSFVEQISWLTLAGPHGYSALHLTLVADTPLNAVSDTGLITLTDCNRLAGHLAAGGTYALGTITPDPASEAASTTLDLGSDGFVQAAIYDMTGRLVESILRQSLSQGSYRLTIPTTELAEGRYVLEITSMGWRATAPFVVNR